MGFNHGWLVQGEAPPAPLFAKFKEVLNKEGVRPYDVAFYFVHWLTDLAGAEPSPLGGAEKFVLKFPHAVLDSFIRSFKVLNELAVKSETAVMEDYLTRTWSELSEKITTIGPAPTDEDGVALMRLALQAQTPDKQSAILQAYRALPKEDVAVLRDEMARTGLSGQTFTAGPKWKESKGPAFLVYYSPAFVRNFAPQHALESLRVLAEVYRRARQMWPIQKEANSDPTGQSVTIRIDQIKELKLLDIQSAFTQGESWVLCRKNDNEAVVERHSLEHHAQVREHATIAALSYRSHHSPLPPLATHHSPPYHHSTGEGEGPQVRDPQILASRSRCGLTLVQGVQRRLHNGKVSRLRGRLLRVCRLTVRSDEPELGDGARRSRAAGKAVGEANVEIGRRAAGVRSIGGGGGLHLSDFR